MLRVAAAVLPYLCDRYFINNNEKKKKYIIQTRIIDINIILLYIFTISLDVWPYCIISLTDDNPTLIIPI